jgi:glycosyltransferase involved in cell wall biosynthesis
MSTLRSLQRTSACGRCRGDLIHIMSREVSFGYVIATVEAQLLKNVRLKAQLLEISDPVVIVNQYQERPIDPAEFGQNVLILNSKTQGLSRSRNLALQNIDVDFVMICDDDIILVPENIAATRVLIGQDAGAAQYFTQLEKTTGEPWRMNYEKEAFAIKSLNFNAKRRIQRINSMEQIYNLRFLQAKNLSFNQDFGVGSNGHQFGEETLMSWSILKAGGQLRYIPLVTRIHPPFSSGTKYSSRQMHTVFAVYRKVFGFFGIFVFMAFAIKVMARVVQRRIGSV